MPRFATSWPTDAFDTQIEGVPVITLSGVDVPTEHLEAVQESARLSRVGLIEIEDGAPAPDTAQLFTQSTTTPAPPAAAPAPATTPEG